MSFGYRGLNVTMGNYLEVFKGYSADVLDEVRCAILDDTPIEAIIDSCSGNAYLLGQLRKALREYLPAKYINTHLSGECIRMIRELYAKKSGNLSQIDDYIPQGAKPEVDIETLELMLKSMCKGVDISRTDFRKVSKDAVSIFCEGLEKGYPMWLCLRDGEPLEGAVVRALIKGMTIGVDIHPFLLGKWEAVNILLLLSNSHRVDINNILKYVNSQYSFDQLCVIIECAECKLPYSKLCLRYEDGEPAFNVHQMRALTFALDNDVDVSSFYSPTVSDAQMYKFCDEVLEARKKEGSKKLSGVLRK